MTRALKGGPLTGCEVMAFAVIRNSAVVRSFYEETLGLRIVSDDDISLVIDSGGTIIRLQKIKDHEPAPHTVLGWTVPDIRATAARLSAAGVRFERYEWMNFQTQDGIATFPNGDMVAWFKDPEGNVLSIAQLR